MCGASYFSLNIPDSVSDSIRSSFYVIEFNTFYFLFRFASFSFALHTLDSILFSCQTDFLAERTYVLALSFTSGREARTFKSSHLANADVLFFVCVQMP